MSPGVAIGYCRHNVEPVPGNAIPTDLWTKVQTG